jgi:ferrous iron transport protein B
MGAIAREAGKKWMMFSFFWGLNIAYTTATLFYQTVTFAGHPAFSAACLISVLILNGIILLTLRKAGSRVQTIPVMLREDDKVSCRGCHGGCDKQKGYAQ